MFGKKFTAMLLTGVFCAGAVVAPVGVASASAASFADYEYQELSSKSDREKERNERLFQKRFDRNLKRKLEADAKKSSGETEKERRARERRERRERERLEREYKHKDKKYSAGERNTAAAVGAVLGYALGRATK